MSTPHTQRQEPLPALARRDIYEVHVKHVPVCRFCDGEDYITVPEPVEGTLAELATRIPAAVAEAMEETGWRDGACPLCAFAHREQLRDEARADDDRSLELEGAA